MTREEALEYHLAGRYRTLADGSPWPYVTGILEAPAHPDHQRVLEQVSRHSALEPQRLLGIVLNPFVRGQDWDSGYGIVIPAHEVDRVLGEVS